MRVLASFHRFVLCVELVFAWRYPCLEHSDRQLSLPCNLHCSIGCICGEGSKVLSEEEVWQNVRYAIFSASASDFREKAENRWHIFCDCSKEHGFVISRLSVPFLTTISASVCAGCVKSRTKSKSDSDSIEYPVFAGQFSAVEPRFVPLLSRFF
jgi:hypothetical protein